MKVVGALATIVALAGGAVALLFTLEPNLRPCFATSASFVSAPVFPGVSYEQYLIDQGKTLAEAKQGSKIVGAEVRFDYDVSGYRGKQLPILLSLFPVYKDGSLGPVVPIEDRNAAIRVEPKSCSERAGYDAFVFIPDPTQRYRVLLELYSDNSLSTRLDLIETDTFRG